MTFVSLNEREAEELALEKGLEIQKIYYTDKRAEGNSHFLCIRERVLESGTVELVFSNFKL